VDTRGYRGKVRKSAKVYTNDPKNPVTTLVLEGVVKVPIFVSSQYVRLGGVTGAKATGSIDIRAEKETPLSLEPVSFNLDKKATYRIEEVEPGKAFKVTFTNISESDETYLGFLTLKTNYPEKPEITIRIRGRFKN